MKTYKRLPKNVREKLQEIVIENERLKNCYFWKPPFHAASRRQQEFKNEIGFIYKEVEYYIYQKLEISCRYYYYSIYITKNGKRSNITVIKNLLKKLES